MPGGTPSAIDPALSDPPGPADHDALAKLGSLAPRRRPGRRSGRSTVSRWDRPPEPHDWRWAVGGLGRVLISVGILMFAFVGYQLYGTGIQTAQAQNRLENEFEDLLADAGRTTTSTPAAPASTVVADVPESTPSTSVAAAEPVPTDTTVPPAAFIPPAEGNALAQIAIPAIGLEKIVIEGVSPSDLEDGPGHFPETPLPGQYGNAAIAGHRTTHGQPFNRIDELQVGDDIVVTTVAGTYTYVVTGQIIVSPNDYQQVIPTLDPDVATLTLTSCHPEFSAKQRIVVTSVLDAARSDVVTARWVPLVRDPSAPAVIPGDDETTSSTDAGSDATTTVPDTAPVTPSTLGGAIDDVLAGGAGSVTIPADLEQVARESQDLFENSWFSDPGAFPQVAWWGLALTLIAIGATALSRRFRRNWVGALAGVVPFIVVLYFWFENVNRLLPPNL